MESESEHDLESAMLLHPLLVHVWLLNKHPAKQQSCESSLKKVFDHLRFHSLDSEHAPVHDHADCACAFDDAERPVRKLMRKNPVDGLLILISCAVRLQEDKIFMSVDGKEIDEPVYTHSENPDWPLLDRLLDNVWGPRIKNFRHLPRVYLLNAHAVDGVDAGDMQAVAAWTQWCNALTESFRFPSVQRAIMECRTYEERTDGFHRSMHRNSALLLALGENGIDAFAAALEDWYTPLPTESVAKVAARMMRTCGLTGQRLPGGVAQLLADFVTPVDATLRGLLMELDESNANVTLVQCLLKKKYSLYDSKSIG